MVPSWPFLRLSAASRFRGRFVLPGDKSLCHRLAILGALAAGETRAANFSTAADCDSTLRCLGLLGVESSRHLGTVTIAGSGWVALASDGPPIVLRTEEAPTFVDTDAIVAWSRGLNVSLHRSAGLKALVGRGSGEAFQLAFGGAGYVVVQPSER